MFKQRTHIKEQRREDGRLLSNALQYEMVERVADQVYVEMCARNTNKYDNCKPRRWSMHGGSGTSQSHAKRS